MGGANSNRVAPQTDLLLSQILFAILQLRESARPHDFPTGFRPTDHRVVTLGALWALSVLSDNQTLRPPLFTIA